MLDLEKNKRLEKCLVWISCILGFFITTPYILTFSGKLSTDSYAWGDFGAYVQGTAGVVLSYITVIYLLMTYQTQSQLSYKQIFVSSFFNLLQTQRDICNNLYFSHQHPHLEKKGQAAIKELVKLFCSSLNTTVEDYKEYTNRVVTRISNQNSYFVSCYMKHLYHTLFYLDESEITYSEKLKYVNLMNAQMTDNELYLCLLISTLESQKKFYDLTKKYDFFYDLHGVNPDGDLVIYNMINAGFFKDLKFKHFNIN